MNVKQKLVGNPPFERKDHRIDRLIQDRSDLDSYQRHFNLRRPLELLSSLKTRVSKNQIVQVSSQTLKHKNCVWDLLRLYRPDVRTKTFHDQLF